MKLLSGEFLLTGLVTTDQPLMEGLCDLPFKYTQRKVKNPLQEYSLTYIP